MKIMFPDYTACPTNITSSIIKYFDCTAPHASLPILDEILKRKQYRNVILYLCDGLGTALVKEHLSEDSFLRKHFLTSLCSVFPSTTTSATTSFLSGMEPCEHGWLGWDLYFEKEDKIVTMFRNNIKDTSIPAADYDVAETTYPYKRIHEIINEAKNHQGTTLYPFRYTVYQDNEDLQKQVVELLDQKERNFMHVYDTQPDSLIHREGCYSPLVHEKIRQINDQIEELSKKLHDTLLIVTADHGLIDVEPLYISDYPDIEELLIRDISIESRAAAFYVKEGCQRLFSERFQSHFKDEFLLLSKQEVLQKQLFGLSENHPLFEKSIGDFLAVSVSDKVLLSNRECMVLKAGHAGLTAAEMQIPLIVVECD